MTTHAVKGGDPTTDNYVVTGGSFDVAGALKADGFDASEDGTGRGTPLVPISFGAQMSTPQVDADMVQTLGAKNPMAVAFQGGVTGVREYNSAGSLRANGPGHDPVGTRVRQGAAVRRLTPVECERLQGFPDGYTAVPYRGKPAADGPRYKALGNSMAVNCMAWIGMRIQMVEDL